MPIKYKVPLCNLTLYFDFVTLFYTKIRAQKIKKKTIKLLDKQIFPKYYLLKFVQDHLSLSYFQQ